MADTQGLEVEVQVGCNHWQSKIIIFNWNTNCVPQNLLSSKAQSTYSHNSCVDILVDAYADIALKKQMFPAMIVIYNFNYVYTVFRISSNKNKTTHF